MISRMVISRGKGGELTIIQGPKSYPLEVGDLVVFLCPADPATPDLRFRHLVD